MSTKKAIPVLMYHSVGRSISEWNWSYLTVPYHIFVDHLKWLAKEKYQTVDLHQLHDHVSGKRILPPRSVVLTFDDGYVDNWTYVAPLLGRHSFKATVFVNPEFVDPRDIIRPTLEDVWAGRIEENELEVQGFMSWPELEKISQSGVFSVQSHLMSHTWYPISNEVIDFRHPGDSYYWMDWNARLEEKPFYLLKASANIVPFGSPIYEHGKSMEAYRYFPDEGENFHLAEYVASQGGSDFFNERDWREELNAELLRFRGKSNNSGRHETQQERLNRLDYEMKESKRLIEEHLGTEVTFLAWPGGAYDDRTMKMAKMIYKSVTRGSKDLSIGFNRPGDDPREIKRVGAPYIQYKRNLFYVGGRYLVKYLDEYRGETLSRKRRQVMKAIYLLALRVYPKAITKLGEDRRKTLH